ncbi:MAG TPA: OmpA family protein [Gallionella sp.]|nr:OmpA family protein [Gallionella sp.]
MTRKIHIGMAVLAAAFITSGCVSTGEFEKMQAGKNEEIRTLQQQKAALEQQKNAAEQDNSALKQQLAAHEQQNTAMQEHVGTLEEQKAALLAASQQRQQQYDALVLGLAKEVEKGQLQVRQYKDMLTVDLAEQIFFDSGRATLKSGGKDVLKKVGEALKGYENKVIRVVGHTDNVPVAKALQATFPSNWELSVARATNVVRFLQEVGIPPERMVASGRSEYDPVASNDTPEGRQKNRRIEIMLIDKSLANEMAKPAN